VRISFPFSIVITKLVLVTIDIDGLCRACQGRLAKHELSDKACHGQDLHNIFGDVEACENAGIGPH
jgi:hypothetical protein